MQPKDNLAPMDLEAQLAASLKALLSCNWCGKPVGRINTRHLICKRVDLNGRTEWQITSDLDLEVRHHPCDSMIRIKQGGTSAVFLSLEEIRKLRDVFAIIIEDQRRFDEEKIKS